MKNFCKPLVMLFALICSSQSLADIVEHEIIVLLDASGSVFDSDYSRWNSMLALTELIVTSTEADNAHGIGIFSGCSSRFTPASCADQTGRLNMDYGLHTGAIDPFTGATIPGDQSQGAVTTFVQDLDETDFLGGFSWHDEALKMALDSFQASQNTVNGNRYIFLLTDGAVPSEDHSPYDSNGFASPTLIALRDLGVDINAIEFGPSPDIDFLEGLTGDASNLFSASGFSGVDINNIVPAATPAPLPITLFALGLVGLLLRRR